MEADSETVGFVAKAAKEHNPELIRFTLQRLAFAGEKHLLALLGEGADVEILVQIKLAQGLHHGRQLALAAVDHHHIGPVVEAVGLQSAATFVTQGTHIHPFRLGPGPAPKTTAHDFRHRHEVVAVASSDAAAADLVLAVVLLGGQPVDEHHLGGHGIAALDVTDVVALDPSRRGGQLQQLRQILRGQRLLLLTLLGAEQLKLRVALHQFDQVGFLLALRAVDLHPTLALFREPILHQFLLGQSVLHQQLGGHLNGIHLAVVLFDHPLQDQSRFQT